MVKRLNHIILVFIKTKTAGLLNEDISVKLLCSSEGKGKCHKEQVTMKTSRMLFH